MDAMAVDTALRSYYPDAELGSTHYSAQLNSGNYGVIVLFYTTTFSSAPELTGTYASE